MNKTRGALLALSLLAAAAAVLAQSPEATIRKNLSERIPQLRKIDEVTKTPMPGVYEVRVGGDLYYSDAEGNYVIEGHMLDARTRRDLTEERQNKLSAVDFDQLPFKDAFTIVRGNGKRKVALFEDPNCGYCKRMERDLQGLDNVTMYVFLYPVLGPDSMMKSRDIWCSGDKGKAWLDWMVRAKSAAPGSCDASAVARNLEFGRRYRITGTPTMFLADGTRVPGALNLQEVEKLLAAVK